ELSEDVIVGTRGQDSGFPNSDLPHQAQIAAYRANPSRDFRKLVAQLKASPHRLAIQLRVKKEFGLPDDAVGAAEPMQHRVQLHNLIDGVRRARLLAVAKGGVGNEELGGGVGSLNLSIEVDSRNRVIWKGLAKQVGTFDVE